MYRALILDWSGTLVDDTMPTLMATNAVLGKYDKEPMTWEQFRSSFRLPYSEWYEEHVPGISLEDLEEHFRAAFDVSEESVTLEGTREFLEGARRMKFGSSCSPVWMGIFSESRCEDLDSVATSRISMLVCWTKGR